ncbi:hypothetical protein ACCS53_37585, partial [Rhizobium ruizarguesonis]
INLVHAGLEAQVHLLPYNQRRVPLLKGRVEYVSADRLTYPQSGQPYFAATIRVTDERLAKMKDVFRSDVGRHDKAIGEWQKIDERFTRADHPT